MDSYNFHPQFEQAVLYYLCSEKKFFHLYHKYIQADLLQTESAKLALSAAKSIYKDISDAPGSTTMVLQRVKSKVISGDVTVDAYNELSFYLDDVPNISDWRAVGSELTPTLKESLRHAAVLKAIESRQGKKSMADTAAYMQEIENIGQYVEGKAPLSFDDIDGRDAFSALEEMIDIGRMRTGVDELDLTLGGGPPCGTLSVFVARPGGGKSMCLSQIGAHAFAAEGKQVAHVTISEVPAHIIMARVLAPILGTKISDITRDPPEARRLWQAYKQRADANLGGYKTFEFTSKTPVSQIRTEVMGFYQKNFKSKPDVIIFDYLGLSSSLKAPKGANSYTQGEYITGELLDWAQSEKVWIFTAAQSQRMKAKGGKAIIGLDDIADSYHIVRIADIVITINTDEDEPGVFQGSFHFAKNRFGPSGGTTSRNPVNWDTGLVAPSSFFQAKATRYWADQQPYFVN